MNQILRFSAVGHSKANLLSLAPLTWWESAYPGSKSASWDAAADSLIRAQEKIGPYDHNKCRGRGVWMDNGRTIFHLGDRIHNGEKEVEIKNFETKFIYECRTGLNSLSKDVLTTQEGAEFLKICEMPTWERPIHARYLAGWSVISTICGGLDWRPSIWITGPSGSGKTWIIERVIQPILGDVRLYAMGKSTEAGLRQALHSDALPIVIEEAEQDNKMQDFHIQGILTLMRQSSSETGAKIYRGTTSGQALEYCIRSTFCFGSIGVGAKHHADQSRVTVLTLLQGDSKKFGVRFEKMKEMVNTTITEEYGAKFRARALKMLPIIRQNANVFSDCVARLLKSKRIGDQIGVLLAGAYSLRCDTLVDREAASEFVQEQDWSDEEAQNDTRDESACLESILQIMIPVSDGPVRRDKQVVELINEIVGKGKAEVTPSVADDYLRRWGIRVDQDNGNVYISNSSMMILKALKDTAWANNYPRMLRRIKGSAAIARMRFTGFSTRCVQIPLAAVLSGQEENAQLEMSPEGGFDDRTSEQPEQ
jgi:putative DNA primase/helicase